MESYRLFDNSGTPGFCGGDSRCNIFRRLWRVLHSRGFVRTFAIASAAFGIALSLFIVLLDYLNYYVSLRACGGAMLI